MRKNLIGGGWGLVLLLAVSIAGCRPSVHELDSRELEDAAMARAATRAQAGEVADAIRQYTEILTASPAVARAHLELAFLYDTPAGDYVRALYHYQRYLELRPATEKRAMIASRVEAARESLASACGHGAAELKERIAELENNLAELQAAYDKLGSSRLNARDRMPEGIQAGLNATVSLPPVKPEDSSPSTRDLNYVVQQRDTLSLLAQRFYSDTRQWQRIYDANRNRIPNPNVLPVGATIVIPDVPAGALEP